MNMLPELVYAASRAVIAGTFLVSGATKLVTQESFMSTLDSLGLPNTWRAKRTVATALPIGELMLAGVLIVGIWLPIGSLIAMLALLGFTALAAWAAHRQISSDCHCFGPLSTSHFNRATVIRNVLLTLCATLLFLTAAFQHAPVSMSPSWATALVLTTSALFGGAAAQASMVLTQLAAREETA